MRCAVPNWTPLFIFCPRIEFRLNDARLVLETHAWQMHKARETGLKTLTVMVIFFGQILKT